jgi:flagellar hook-associated protein 1 FlgK
MEGRLRDYIIATAGHLAIDLNQAGRFRHNYNEMSLATQNQRAAISDVDMNEELLNMTRFNHLFQVHARMIATMNSVYDTLINRLGV